VASNIYKSYDKEILQIKGPNVLKLSSGGIEWPVDAIWFDPGKIYYAVGAGIYTKIELLDNTEWGGPGLSATNFTSFAIRGNHSNDVFVAGSFGDLLHYNGISWKSYREYTALNRGSYRAVAVKDDVVYAVGSDNARAVILVGKRK